MKELLNSKRTGLYLFDDPIVIDYSLPKWVNAKKDSPVGGNNYYTYHNVINDADTMTTGSVTNENPSFVTFNVFNNGDDGGNDGGKVGFDEISTLGLKDLNRFVNENKGGIKSVLGITGSYGGNSTVPWAYESNENKKPSLFDRVKHLFKREPKPEFDAIQFFTAIKATTLESANGYVDRVSKYLTAIHRAASIGQTALVSKLAREMLGNRYESFLAAEGYYHVVTEEQVVKFAKKSEKGIAIDYIKNFVRPIPTEVIDKIIEASNLEVFDNYVIMHYDPDAESYMDTPKEEIKRRDPIVFGVIAGSRKLYYITDWIDEYCDLTLEKFVDTIGITKDDLVEDEIEKSKIDEARAAKAKEEAAKKAAVKKAEKKETKKTVKTEKKTNTKKRTTKKTK